MDVKEVVRICKILGCTANMSVDGEGHTIGKANFHGARREDILKHAEEIGLGKVKKIYWSESGITDVDWSTNTMIFNRAEACRITGYKTIDVPAQPATKKRVPVFDCSKPKA